MHDDINSAADKFIADIGIAISNRDSDLIRRAFKAGYISAEKKISDENHAARCASNRARFFTDSYLDDISATDKF